MKTKKCGISSMNLKILPLLVLLTVGLSLFASGCTGPGDSQVNKSTGQGSSRDGRAYSCSRKCASSSRICRKSGWRQSKNRCRYSPGSDPHTYEPSPRETGKSERGPYVCYGRDSACLLKKSGSPGSKAPIVELS